MPNLPSRLKPNRNIQLRWASRVYAGDIESVLTRGRRGGLIAGEGAGMVLILAGLAAIDGRVPRLFSPSRAAR